MNRRLIILILFLLSARYSVGQTDSAQMSGTIRIAKPEDIKPDLKVSVEFGIRGKDRFQPFPVVDGFAFPFNYTKYFRDKFKASKIDLHGKKMDTVYIEVQVRKNGKASFKNLNSSAVNKTDLVYEGKKPDPVKPTELELQCLYFIGQIEEWMPAYEIKPEIGKFKNTTVLKPVKNDFTCTGVITIIFSVESFED